MKQLIYNGVQISNTQLNLKMTLVNGQCFNWWSMGDSEKEYIGVVDQSVILIKDVDSKIEYQFLAGETDLESYFNLQVNMDELLQRWNQDEFFKSISKDHTGLRIVKQDPFECLISFIVSSNNNIKRITTNLKSIRAFGTPLVEHSGIQYYAFPTLEQLSNLAKKELDSLGLGYRSQYITKTVTLLKELDGEGYLKKLYGQDCLEQLLQFHGVGRKVADCVRLYSLGAHSIVPIDTHIHQVYVEKYKNNLKDDHDKVQEFFRQTLGDYAGWAQSYLFTSQLKSHSKQKQKKIKGISKTLKM